MKKDVILESAELAVRFIEALTKTPRPEDLTPTEILLLMPDDSAREFYITLANVAFNYLIEKADGKVICPKVVLQ